MRRVELLALLLVEVLFLWLAGGARDYLSARSFALLRLAVEVDRICRSFSLTSKVGFLPLRLRRFARVLEERSGPLDVRCIDRAARRQRINGKRLPKERPG